MSIFDSPTQTAKPNLLNNVQRSGAQAANFLADIGGGIKSVFSHGPLLNVQDPTQRAAQPSGITAPASISPTMAGLTPLGASPSPAPSAPHIPFVNTAQAQTVPNGPVPQAGQPTQTVNGTTYVGNFLPPVSRVTPQNFNIPSQNTYPSTSINTGRTMADLTTRHDELLNGLGNGQSTGVPTDNLLASLAGNIYQSSLYTPEEQSQMQSLANINQRILATQLAEKRQIKQLQEDGMISKEQGASFITESQRRADAQLADLAVQQSGSSLNLQVLGQIRGNQLTGFQNLAGLLKPEAVAPGSTLINPLGQTIGSSTGVAPATAASYASQLFNDDLKTGTAQLLPNGQVNTAYYFQKAQGILGGQGGFGGMPTGGMSGTPQNTGGIGGLPAAVQPYVIQSSDGSSYINADKVPQGQLDFIKQQAAQAGVPFLSTEDVGKLRNIQVTNSNLDQLQGEISNILGSGLSGRIIGGATNTIKSLLQTDPNIAAFKVYRDTAINTIQALAGGSGSGFRLNQTEVDTATSNLPEITDNIETADTKLNLLRGFLSKWQNQLLTGNPVNTSGAQGATIVQTKAGPINTNW